MSLLNAFRKTIFWRAIRKYQSIRNKMRFNGKPLTIAMQSEMQKIIKKRREIYLNDEKTARQIADGWHGNIQKPQNLRFIDGAIPVVMCTNDNFAPYMAVMLQSLLDNSNQQRKYHFIIFGSNLSDNTKICLTEQVSKFSHCEIDFVETTDAFDGIPIGSTSGCFSIDTYSRLFIPYWLDKYNKVIYCDGDMIAKADIAELYDLDMQDYSIAATMSQSISSFLRRMEHAPLIVSSAVFMLLEKWSYYLSAGLLVFNNNKFSDKFSYQDFFKFAIYFTNRYRIHFNDQDVLSLMVKDDYFVLPPSWNYCWGTPSEDSDGNVVRYQASKSDDKIIHFTTTVKPWKDLPKIANNPDAIAYREYALNVPLYNSRRLSQ